MKSLSQFINESRGKGGTTIINEGEIKSEDDFREYAENKFKEVFGDDHRRYFKG